MSAPTAGFLTYELPFLRRVAVQKTAGRPLKDLLRFGGRRPLRLGWTDLQTHSRLHGDFQKGDDPFWPFE